MGASELGVKWQKLRAFCRETMPSICHFCGEWIDKTLPRTHKKSWTLDHLKSVADYPHLAYEITNVAPAHRDCNGRAGAKRNKPPKQTSCKSQVDW